MTEEKGAGIESPRIPQEAHKRCNCPGDTAARGTAAKRPKPTRGAGKEGLLIRLLPPPDHELSEQLRPPRAPRRAAPRPMASTSPPAMLLVSQQPVGVIPPFPGVATAPYVASPTYVPLTPGCVPLPVTAVANAAHGSDAACRACCCKTSHRHCCSGGSEYGAQNTFNIPPYAMPFFGEVYRNAARASEPPAGGGNVNVVTKVTSNERKRKKRAKKQRDSSSDSSDSYSKKSRKSEARREEPPQPNYIVMPTPAPAPPVVPVPEVLRKPQDPEKENKAPEMNPDISPTPTMYPPAEEGLQAADEDQLSKPEEQDNAEGEQGCSRLACIVVLVVVGVCIVIAIVLALFPSILFGKKDESSQNLHEAHALLHRAAAELDLFGGRRNSSLHDGATSRTSEKSPATSNEEEQWTDRI